MKNKMTIKTNKKKLEAFLATAKQDTTWKEEAKKQIENEVTLDRSFKIALKAYQRLKAMGKTQEWLAAEMEISTQAVSKMLKGDKNFTLLTIERLERALGIKLIEVVAHQRTTTHQEVFKKSPKVINFSQSKTTFSTKKVVYESDFFEADIETLPIAS